MTDRQDELQQLLDRQAITDRIHDYARAMDRLDAELGKACFHDDAEVDYGAQAFRGTGYGFVDMCMAAHPNFLGHSHRCSNIRIWLQLDGSARSETYIDVALHLPGEDGRPRTIHQLGRYVDEWSRRDDAWRITRRRYLLDVDRSDAGLGPFEITGKRDRTDPSYFGG